MIQRKAMEVLAEAGPDSVGSVTRLQRSAVSFVEARLHVQDQPRKKKIERRLNDVGWHRGKCS